MLLAGRQRALRQPTVLTVLLAAHLEPPPRPPPPFHPRDGSIYAYAVSYDWSRGYSEHNPATAKNYIFLHAPQEAEVKSRNRPASTRR